MKKTKLKLITAVFFASAMIASVVPSYAGSNLTDATVQSYEDQIADIQRKKDEALSALESIEREQASTWNKITELDNIIEYNNQMKNLAEAQIDMLNEQIIEKNASISEKEKLIEEQEEAFVDRMVSVYMEEKADYIELILGSETLHDFLTRLDYINSILDYDEKIIKDLNNTKTSLEEDREKLEAAQETQKLRVADFEAAITQNQAVYDEKLGYMSSLEQNEAEWTASYNYNRQQEEALNAELENYLAELQKKSQSQYVGGTIGWPLDLNAYYYVSSEFGWRVLQGVDDYHLGIDLACANGTNVYSSNAGTVLKSEKHWSYGNYILIDHGGGYSTLYAHLDDRLVSVGETVSAGQLIGHVGLTGNTFGYHLHFETRINGKVDNPRNYLVFP